MINMGDEYLLTEALITLFLYKKVEIFVTVRTDEEAKLIESRFPEVSAYFTPKKYAIHW